MEFLVRMEVGIEHLSRERQQQLLEEEAQRAAELAGAGTLRALWRIPGRRANYGLWVAQDPDGLHLAITSLPLWPWAQVEVTALATHPNDPRKADQF